MFPWHKSIMVIYFFDYILISFITALKSHMASGISSTFNNNMFLIDNEEENYDF